MDAAAWIGRTQDDSGTISETRARQLHATLHSSDTATPKAGDILSPLWHWCAFPPLTHTDALGRDGHPVPGDFLPALPLERRMWAGGALTFHAPLTVGEPRPALH